MKMNTNFLIINFFTLYYGWSQQNGLFNEKKQSGAFLNMHFCYFYCMHIVFYSSVFQRLCMFELQPTDNQIYKKPVTDIVVL